MTENKQLETLKKNILSLSLAHGMLRESQFSKGVFHAIDEILKNTGLTIESLQKEQREKEATTEIPQNDENKEDADTIKGINDYFEEFKNAWED